MFLIKLNKEGHVLLSEDLMQRFANVTAFDVHVEEDSIRLTPLRHDAQPDEELALAGSASIAAI